MDRIGVPTSILVSWDDASKIRKNDEWRHQFLVHALSHHIHNDVGEYTFWLFDDHGWLYEGLAHFHEIRQFGQVRVYCGQEQVDEVRHWRSPHWESNVKKAVMAGEEVAFPNVINRNVTSLSIKDRQFAWSYVDYLMWENPGKMDEFLTALKGPRLKTRDALKQAYGLTMGQLQDGWKEFVMAEYRVKPRKKPYERPPKRPPE